MRVLTWQPGLEGKAAQTFERAWLLRAVLLLIFSLPTPCKTATLSFRDCSIPGTRHSPGEAQSPPLPLHPLTWWDNRRSFSYRGRKLVALAVLLDSVEDESKMLYLYCFFSTEILFIGKPEGLEWPLLPCSVEPQYISVFSFVKWTSHVLNKTWDNECKGSLYMWSVILVADCTELN